TTWRTCIACLLLVRLVHCHVPRVGSTLDKKLHPAGYPLIPVGDRVRASVTSMPRSRANIHNTLVSGLRQVSAPALLQPRQNAFARLCSIAGPPPFQATGPAT